MALRVGKPAIFVSGIGIAVMILTGALLADRWPRERSPEAIVATVDGEAITAGELVSRAARLNHRAAAGSADSETLKRAALEEVVRIKLQQLLARSHGLDVAITGAEFQRGFAAENKRRQSAADNGEVIYGPLQFTEAAYFEYTFANMTAKLKQRLAGGGVIQLSDDVLLDHYEALKNKLYLVEAEVTVYKIRFSHLDKNGKLSDTKQQASLALIREVQARLEQGDSFAALASEYNETAAERDSRGVQTFDSSTAREDQLSNPLLRSAAQQLEPGAISEMIEAGNAYYLLQVIDKKPGGFRPYADVREDVRTRYIEQAYSELVDRMARDAAVEIRKETYEALALPTP